MAKTLNNEIRSKLTEHTVNYKLCNLNLIGCYSGLYPATLTKLSMTIFTQILSNKFYYKEDSQHFNKDEERRIYTSLSVTPITLLENCHPVKYCAEGKVAQKDVGNIVKRINELDQNNIFYVWKCGYPKNYMFVLERDIGLWKYYNPKAYVTPKTLRKIIIATKNMTNTMHRILQESGDRSTIHEVRNSFCQFINHMISKLNPLVAKNLTLWDESKECREYILGLNREVKALDPYDGYEEDESFFDRLPLEVKLKVKPPKRERPKHKELELELLPQDDNVVKRTNKRKKKRIPIKGALAEFETFKDCDPMKNANSFCQFYRSLVKSKNDGAQFDDFRTESQPAATILDKIKGNGQNEVFLRSWILFYVDSKLKGNNIKNKQKTSLRSFEKTYDEYNSRYIGCEV